MSSAVTAFASEQERDYILCFGDVEVNFDRATVSKAGKRMNLSSAEYELLLYFVLNPERELSRDMILESVWSYLPSPNTRTVDAHVLRLRQKLEDDPNAPRHFVTLHRVGYCFRQ
jgi:DNA-binding response OmpR family regulator